MQKKNLKICKQSSKKFLSILTVFFVCTQFILSAHSGMFSGEKNLRLVKTKWFDIIFPARCEKSASILYEKADSVYEEVTAQYGLTPSFRMPVVITPAVERFNAFWEGAPYNHIAIYDTGVSGASEIAVFSETLISVFRHELTHAVTYNMKNGFWRFIGNVFGDCIAPGMISVTTGMAEGATVTSESAAGEGRLNDEFAKHFVKQAKIEGKFPSYHDVSGASDTAPDGAAYYFNGAFHQWLQERFGMEPYAQFWYRVVNGKNITISGAFKDSFGIKLREAWKQFEKDYEVPELAANPVKAGLVEDFFEPKALSYSLKNEAGSMYESLTSSGFTETASAQRLAWLEASTGRVYLAEAGAQNSSKTGFRKLFTLRGCTSVRLSNDGRFLAAGYINGNSGGAKARVKIYDIERDRFYSVKEKGLVDAAVLHRDGVWYLVAQKYFAQHYSLVVYRLLTKDGARSSRDYSICGTELISEVKFAPENIPYAFTALESGNIAYLKKDRQNYSLCISSVDGSLLKEIHFPQGMVVRSLSYGLDNAKQVLIFSYAEKGTMPRAGIMEIESGLISLSSQDLSGGVYEPVFWNDKIVYLGKFYRQNRLLSMKKNEGGQTEKITAELFDSEKKSAEELQPLLERTSLVSESFNPLPYLFKGLFLPFSIYNMTFSDITPKVNSLSTFMDNYFLGATYITSSPWSDGSTDLITLTGGFNVVKKTFGTHLSLQNGTSTSLLRSKTDFKAEFDESGWKQGEVTLLLQSVIRTGNISSITLSNSSSAFALNSKRKFELIDVFSIKYSTIRYGGPGRFEKQGLAFSFGGSAQYIASMDDVYKADKTSPYFFVSASACLPHLLPFESKYGFSYNLPASFGFTLLPVSSKYGYVNLKSENKNIGRVLFDASFETVLFGLEIQKAVPGITALFLNDFYISAGYASTGTTGSAAKKGLEMNQLGDYFKAVTDGRGYYFDSVYLKTGIEFTPNIGFFAKSGYKMALTAMISYTLHSVKKLRPEESFRFSFGLDANF